jgi:hypothetical protein
MRKEPNIEQNLLVYMSNNNIYPHVDERYELMFYIPEEHQLYILLENGKELIFDLDIEQILNIMHDGEINESCLVR